MKKIEKNQKLEAPITLTLDQIAMVAAGQVASSNTVRKGAIGPASPGTKTVATNSSVKLDL